MPELNDATRAEHFIEWYKENQKRFSDVSEYVYDKVLRYLEQQDLAVAKISYRTKNVDSVYKKAKKTRKSANGAYVPKYNNPKNEIMDFSGVRVVVYLASDVNIVCSAVERLFEDCILYDDSENKLDLLGKDRVGYLSVHYVITIHSSELQYANLEGLKCEIQVRTVLQDAWAQVFHDRVYKGADERVGDSSLIRKTNLLSGSLELIDSQIDEIVRLFDRENGNFDNKAYQNLLNQRISEETLQEYCNLLSRGKAERFYSYSQVSELLASLKINTVMELDCRVNIGFINKLLNTNITLTIDRLIRYIIFLDDYNILFSTIDPTQKFVISKEIYNLLDEFIDMKDVCDKHNNLVIYEKKEN